LKLRAPQINNEELSSIETPQEVGILDGFPHSSLETSNDLLFKLHGAYAPRPLNYETVVHSADEGQDIRNAPTPSTGTCLEK
jgi:hypothetical protein